MKVRKKRTYVKHGVCHLGNGQTGGFFPLAAPLDRILAGPVIDNIAALLIKGVIKKIIGRERHHLEDEDRDVTIELYITEICLKT